MRVLSSLASLALLAALPGCERGVPLPLEPLPRLAPQAEANELAANPTVQTRWALAPSEAELAPDEAIGVWQGLVRRYARILRLPGESRTAVPAGVEEVRFAMSHPLVLGGGGACKVRAEVSWDAGAGATVDLPASAGEDAWVPVSLAAKPSTRPTTLAVRIRGDSECASAAVVVAQSEVTPLARRAREARPNVVMLIVDTLRQDALDCADGARAGAPFVLRDWCKRGAYFGNAYSTTSWTAPSIASMLTGLWPRQHQYVFLERKLNPLVPKVTTVASRLRDAGYTTFGLATNAYFSGGLGYGYDEHYEIFRKTGAELSTERHAGTVVDRLQAWLEKSRQDPFFMTVHFTDVHQPVDAMKVTGDPIPECDGVQPWPHNWEGLMQPTPSPTPADQKRLACRWALYRYCLRYLDRQLERLDGALEKLGLAGNTWIIVVADHGEEFWDHALEEYAARGPMQTQWGTAHGHTLYRELVHVPLLIVPPRGSTSVPPGPRPGLVSTLDLFATILGLGGAPVPTNTSSHDLAPMLADPAAPGRDLALSETTLRGTHRLAITTRQLRAIQVEGSPPLVFDIADVAERSPLPPGSPKYDRAVSLLERASHHAQATGLTGAELESLRALGYVQ